MGPLYFMPGENFGYSIGHRILGWMLLDYWRYEPEGRSDWKLDDVFRFLIYEPLGMDNTYFINKRFEKPHSLMGRFFNMGYFDKPNESNDDDPADLALASSGSDMMKLTMMALRRGDLPDGTPYISKWDEWAAVNKLPGNKLSTALTHWRLEGNDDINFIWRTLVTRTINAGPFGWSYFGATYHDVDPSFEGDAGMPVAVGWKGFSSCGCRADYKQGFAFVVMQECVPDPGNRNFAECIHGGKFDKFELGEVAKTLAKQHHVDSNRAKKRVCCCHEVMTETKTCNPFVCCAQSVIKCAYCCALPFGVRILKFHKHERLAQKALVGDAVRAKR